jgi:N-acetylglucosamine kinase-like BadF-type ATPase
MKKFALLERRVRAAARHGDEAARQMTWSLCGGSIDTIVEDKRGGQAATTIYGSIVGIIPYEVEYPKQELYHLY